MEALNFVRAAISDVTVQLHQIASNHKISVTQMRDVLEMARKAQKFILPDTGRIFDDNLKGLPDDINLPYPEIVIEYKAHPLSSADNGEIEAKKRIVVAKQLSKNAIAVFSIVNIPVNGRLTWTMLPYWQIIENDPNRVATAVDISSNPDIKIAGSVHLFNGLNSLMPNNWEEQAVEDLRDESLAVVELIEFLSCSNTCYEKLPARKINKSASKKGAKPFDDYHVLVVKHNDSDKKSFLEASTSERRSPREHPRRGHIRIIGNETKKKIFVQSCIVNAGVGGKITKTYKV